ncbi:rhodanese-like domain-containing protein [Bacillus marinisedimentorum]|uniref:rhodanese-like domain-containing protein n=1 Tax=Bacillus marinisedimentorum TaxID=1821260 RepID=UPI0007E07FB8|nr:rhodanese-like domain-containing protein [Bacillus marinisedimentorum]
MDWIWIIALGLVVFLFIKRSAPAKGVRQLTTAELADEMKKNNKTAYYIDVRTPGEYKSGHIKKFKNIPLQQIQARTSELPKDKELVLICQSGNRSGVASKKLKKLGFEKVANVRGGMSAWQGQRV